MMVCPMKKTKITFNKPRLDTGHAGKTRSFSNVMPPPILEKRTWQNDMGILWNYDLVISCVPDFDMRPKSLMLLV